MVPSASRSRSGTRRSESCSLVRPSPSATSEIISWARTLSALNFARWAMPCRCSSATSLPISARTPKPSTARRCEPSPGQSRRIGVSRRTVSSSPREPSACRIQLSLPGMAACRHSSNRAQAKAASESARQASRTTASPGYGSAGFDRASTVSTCRTASSGSASPEASRSCGSTAGCTQAGSTGIRAGRAFSSGSVPSASATISAAASP